MVESSCRQLKEANRIDSYKRDYISGKISVCKNGRHHSINSDQDLGLYWFDDGEYFPFTDSEDSNM